MHVSHAAAPAQKDNLLGICAAIGEDLGFDPIYLRIALGAGILWNPLAILGVYLAAGLVVLTTRLLFPTAKTQPVAEVVPIGTPHRDAALELPLAA